MHQPQQRFCIIPASGTCLPVRVSLRLSHLGCRCITSVSCFASSLSIIDTPRCCQAGNDSLLCSILLTLSPLVTGEDFQTDQVRDEALCVVTETLRVSVDTGTLPSVTSRGNLKATVVPVGPIDRRTSRTVGRLTGGSWVDMKDECHKVCAFSSTRSVVSLSLLPHLRSEIHASHAGWML